MDLETALWIGALVAAARREPVPLYAKIWVDVANLLRQQRAKAKA